MHSFTHTPVRTPSTLHRTTPHYTALHCTTQHDAGTATYTIALTLSPSLSINRSHLHIIDRCLIASLPRGHTQSGRRATWSGNF